MIPLIVSPLLISFCTADVKFQIKYGGGGRQHEYH